MHTLLGILALLTSHLIPTQLQTNGSEVKWHDPWPEHWSRSVRVNVCEFKIVCIRFLILLLLRPFQREHSNNRPLAVPSTGRSERFISPIPTSGAALGKACVTSWNSHFTLHRHSISSPCSWNAGLPIPYKTEPFQIPTWDICCSFLGNYGFTAPP